MKNILFIGLVVTVVLISGCYGPSPTGTPTATKTPIPTATKTPYVTPIVTPTVTPATTPIATQAMSYAVQISNFAFNPGTLTIPRGATVTWTNMDSAPHTVTSTTGVFDSPSLSQGQTFSWTFNQSGTFEYGCTIHPSITHGNIIVT